MRKSTVNGIIGLFLAVVMGAGVCCAGFASRDDNGNWFKNGNLSTWHWSDKNEDILDTNKPDDSITGGGLLNVSGEKGIKLTSARIASEDYDDYGIDTQADTAYTITASVNSDAVDKSVTWGLSWKNSSSTWASGKKISDYATITPTTDKGLTATLTVKQAFGEQINLKVASYLDSTVSATCTVDYLKKMTSFTGILNSSLASNCLARVYVGNTSNTVSVTPVYGVGTVTGNISGYKTTITLGDKMKTSINALMKNGSGTNSFTSKSTMSFTGQTFKLTPFYNVFITGGGNSTGAETLINNYFVQYGFTDSTTIGGAPAASSDAAYTGISYEITYSYGSDYSQKLTATGSSGYFNKKGLSKIATVTNINLDKSNIVVI